MSRSDVMTPGSVEELSDYLRRLSSEGRQMGAWDLSRLPEQFEHESEDLTVTVSSGMRLNVLQERLREKGQWLPLDPAVGSEMSLETLLLWNHFGSNRVGYGLVRDYVLGLEVVLGEGSVVHSGGRVVKNVAGFDLAKLFIGSCGTLGIITGMTFKLLPLPGVSRWVWRRMGTAEGLRGLLGEIRAKGLQPVSWDVESVGIPREWCVWMEFAGAEEAVDYQIKVVNSMGFEGVPDGKVQEWRSRRRELAQTWPPMSLRPDQGLQWLVDQERPGDWLMAPCGCLFSKGAKFRQRGSLSVGVLRLEERVKSKLDPAGVFPTMNQVRKGAL